MRNHKLSEWGQNKGLCFFINMVIKQCLLKGGVFFPIEPIVTPIIHGGRLGTIWMNLNWFRLDVCSWLTADSCSHLWRLQTPDDPPWLGCCCWCSWSWCCCCCYWEKTWTVACGWEKPPAPWAAARLTSLSQCWTHGQLDCHPGSPDCALASYCPEIWAPQ